MARLPPEHPFSTHRHKDFNENHSMQTELSSAANHYHWNPCCSKSNSEQTISCDQVRCDELKQNKSTTKSGMKLEVGKKSVCIGQRTTFAQEIEDTQGRSEVLNF
eukprot:3021479-Amphidinium_carterae.1